MPSPHELLRAYLAERDVDCPVCRYNLRGCDGGKCPECGARLDLRVGSVDLRLGPYLSCVLAIAVPMGFIGVLAVTALIGFLRSSFWGDRDWLILAILWGATAINVAACLLAVGMRARIQRLRALAQWQLVGIVAFVELSLVCWLLWFL